MHFLLFDWDFLIPVYFFLFCAFKKVFVLDVLVWGGGAGRAPLCFFFWGLLF